jgi:MFS family permease
VGINPWFIAITVTLATFMELLDTAIANVALPHIAGGLAVSTDESTWVLTATSCRTPLSCRFPHGLAGCSAASATT